MSVKGVTGYLLYRFGNYTIVILLLAYSTHQTRVKPCDLEGCTLSYILHIRAFGTLLGKIVAGSTQNQQRIVDRGCCFGCVGSVIDQQRVVDQFLLIWSLYRYNFHYPIFLGKHCFFTARIFYPNPTRLGLQG